MIVYGLYHMSMNINMKDSTFFHVKPGKNQSTKTYNTGKY